VKPQFELGRRRPPDDARSLRCALVAARRGVAAAGWLNVECMTSPVLGAKGAHEFLIHARRREKSP
jgi:predicted rRNA methylase YqxC with S4 and FtsJ domains